MSEQNYAISEYPNVKEIYEKIAHLTSLPCQEIKRDAMEQYLKYYETKCAKSKVMIQEAKQYIPGGVQHNLAFNYPFPIVITKAEGAYMWDIDGNKYIDFLQAGGPTILGSNYLPVQEKVLELIKTCGPVTGLFHEYELKIAKEINRHMPSIELFRMLGSGTEADMAAARLARTFTKKKKIIKMGGAYHGWSDQLVYGLHIPGSMGFEAHGIPRGCRAETQEVYPNDIDALERKLKFNQIRGGTAAVFLEPLGPESGTRPVDKDYNKKARELCDQYGALLIFDEVVTGFRIGLGGAQGYYGVKPDLTVFGKIITGGYPAAGALGGRRDVMSLCAAGVESGKKRAYVGGTLSANPMSALAGYYAIKEIERTNACVKAGQAGDRIRKGLQSIIEKNGLPFVVYNQGSIVHLETAAPMMVEIKLLKIKQLLKQISHRKHVMEEMGAVYMAEGIITIAGSRIHLSMADTDDIVDDALGRFDRIFKNIEAKK